MRLEGGDQSSRLYLLDRHDPSVIDSGADGGSLASPHLSASARVSASTRRRESCRSAGANSTRCSSIQPTGLREARALSGNCRRRCRERICRDLLNFRNCREPHACSRGPEGHLQHRKTAPNALFSLVPRKTPSDGGWVALACSSPRAQKHAFSTSAPAELHVRDARREKGARSALGRFEPVGSLASLWDVRNRYPELNFEALNTRPRPGVQSECHE